MKCEKCGTELYRDYSPFSRWETPNDQHTELRCALARVAALETKLVDAETWSSGLQSDCDAMGAKLDTALAKLAECERERDEIQALARENGVSIDRVQNFAAFTPEAKAAHPTQPRWLVRIDHRATAAKLAKAREAIEAAILTEECRDRGDAETAYELRKALAALDPPETATEK